MESAKRKPDTDASSGSGQSLRDIDSAIVAGETRLEELVAEISDTIRAARPERRAGLKELAETLLHDEVASISAVAPQVESVQRRNSSNPLFAGLLLIMLGLGFLLIVPLVGITLAFIGVILAAWGGLMSWSRK